MAAAVRRGALPAAALTISAANPAGQQYCTSECPPRIRLAASKHPCTELSVTASGLAWLGARMRGDGVHGGTMKLRCRPTRSRRVRSEEHTSELQSLMRISYAVFCLKKKKHNYTKHLT